MLSDLIAAFLAGGQILNSIRPVKCLDCVQLMAAAVLGLATVVTIDPVNGMTAEY